MKVRTGLVESLENADVGKRMTEDLDNSPAYLEDVNVDEEPHAPKPHKTKVIQETKTRPRKRTKKTWIRLIKKAYSRRQTTPMMKMCA